MRHCPYPVPQSNLTLRSSGLSSAAADRKRWPTEPCVRFPSEYARIRLRMTKSLSMRRRHGSSSGFPKVSGCDPCAVREALRIRPGQRVQVIQYEDRIELIPIRPTREMRGFLKGMDTTIEREPDRL